jgi:hypothetical protein
MPSGFSDGRRVHWRGGVLFATAAACTLLTVPVAGLSLSPRGWFTLAVHAPYYYIFPRFLLTGRLFDAGLTVPVSLRTDSLFTAGFQRICGLVACVWRFCAYCFH